MFSNNLLVISALTVSVMIAGLQDFRRGEVSNWISIPLLFIGLGGVLVHVSTDWLAGILPILAISILTLAAFKDWMGGADWKILVGLFGLWPLAGLAALITAGVWGGVAILRSGDRNARFPGVAAFALGVTLALCAHLSIMPPRA